MWSSAIAVTLFAVRAHALLRFPCAQMTVTRSDPLVNPNATSAHLHQVVGGNAFDFYMPAGTDLQTSTCSTCSVKENKSNYWTPTLYFQSPVNGTFKRVNQLPGQFTGSPNAGMVVYYIQVGQVTSFPKGFRMLTGNPMLRTYNSSINDSRSIMFRCLSAPGGTDGPDTYTMPTGKCAGGVRSQVNFPTCWNGRDLDSANHKDHVAYANGASFGNFGTGCPSTHPVTIPLLFLETYWDTAAFANDWPSNGKSPFVWSMGDPTGAGYHADYMMGWPEQTLKNAMANCNDQSGQISLCSALTSRSEQEMNDCAVPNRVAENLDGWIATLPGCNPIQQGPGNAAPQTGCGAPTQMLPTTTVSFLKSGISGWTPVGCASENSGETLLSGPKTSGSMTIEKCLNYCNSQGQKFAGLKNKSNCSCGNSLNTSKVSASYACNLPCDGNLNEYCGAVNRVAVYSGAGPVTIPSTTQGPTGTTGPTNTPSPTGAVVPKWGQCGGQGWTGGTVCAAGSTCTYSNPYYSQCL